MQRSQRARDNPALNVAIEAGNLLKKPVIVFFQLLRRSRRANLRHYEFIRRGLEELPSALRQRRVGFVLRRYPENSFLRFCEEVHPCLVIGERESAARGRKSQAACRRAITVAVLDRGCRRYRADAVAR
jgi:deoxyribodipyrimidine photo-lyase